MNTSKKLIGLFVTICIAFVIYGAYYIMGNHQGTIQQVIKAPTVSSGLTVLLPDDISLYKQRMANFVQIGGVDPLLAQVFVKKYLAISYSGDIQKASAEAAAQQFPTGGGPEKVLIDYFKVQSGTAYVVLNIDENGRAGVSVSIAIIHPVVEKTLLQFTGIQNVVFGYASGDKPDTGNQVIDVASGLTVQLPNDLKSYTKKMTDFVQIGGVSPLKTQVFVKKYLAISYSGDIQKASAEAAAQQFPTGGGPEKVLVNYFKVMNKTAYVVLNIDENGRAGVSVSIAIIHPVVEKTLLQFPGIKKVVFGYASGDKQIVQ